MNPYLRIDNLFRCDSSKERQINFGKKEQRTMLQKLIKTDRSTAGSILRIVLGMVFFAHGAQKMLGWFGGSGFQGTLGFFTGMLHIPAPLAVLAIFAEFFGGIGLIFGLLTRVAAFG